MKTKRINKTQLVILELIVNRPHIPSETMKKHKMRFLGPDSLTIQFADNRYRSQAWSLADDFEEIFDFQNNWSVNHLQDFGKLTLKNDLLARKLLTYNEEL